MICDDAAPDDHSADAITEMIQRTHRSTLLSLRSQLRNAIDMKDPTRASILADRILEKSGYGRTDQP